MLHKDTDILKTAKSYAEDVLRVLSSDWDDSVSVDFLTIYAQKKVLEILGEKSRQKKRILKRYLGAYDWSALIKDHIKYSHPDDDSELPSVDVLATYENLDFYAKGLALLLSSDSDMPYEHRLKLEEFAEWIQIAYDIMDPDLKNTEIKYMVFFFALSHSVQMVGEYLSRIDISTRKQIHSEIDWEGWIGYRIKLAHKMDEMEVVRLEREITESAQILLQQLEYLVG